MTNNFGDWATSLEFRDLIETIVTSILEKKRPAPRIAEVTGIDRTTRSLSVRFIGETNDVQVPYTSTAPANIGQYVRIGGTTHDRHVQDVVGETELEVRATITEGRVKSVLDKVSPGWQTTAVDDLPEKVGGYFTGVEEKIDATKSESDLNFVAIRSTRPLYEGVDPTGESTFDYQLLVPTIYGNTNSAVANDGQSHVHGVPTVTPSLGMTASTSFMGFIRCNLASEKRLASWLAYKTGTVTGFYFDVYRMDQSDGSIIKVLGSGNMASELTGSMAWMTKQFPLFYTQPGDVYALKYRMEGSGTVMMAGIRLPAPLPPAGFRPAQIGAVQTSGVATNPSPGIITAAELDAMYSGQTIYFQLGNSVVASSIPRKIYDPLAAMPFNQNWRAANAGGVMTINSNGVATRISGDGYGILMYGGAMTTDNVRIKCQINTNSGSSYVSFVIGRLALDGPYVEAQFYNNKIRIATLNSFYSGMTVRAEVSGSTRQDWTPVFRYVASTRTYEVYLSETETAPVLTWADMTYIVPKDNSAYRFVGFGVQQGFFDNAGGVVNFSAEDY